MTSTAATTTTTDDSGIWIGIDFGTTHCSVAIYDATRGGPKWIRLSSAIPETTKHGRIVPTQLVLSSPNSTANHQAASSLLKDLSSRAIVGYPVWKILHENNNEKYSYIPNLKRNFAQSPQGSWTHKNDSPTLQWIDAVALVLQQLRQEADDYIRTQQIKKHLQTPGHGLCRNVVLGVPARYTTRQRHGMIEAARRAGFAGHVSTVTESTAAAMAYGLFVGKRVNDQTRILVFDMGGGTTDVTIAVLHPPDRRDNHNNNNNNSDPSQRFQVESTLGDDQLGGDDMDEAVMHFLIQKHRFDRPNDPIQQRQFLRICQQAKEALTEHEHTQIRWHESSIRFTRPEFDTAIAPLLQRARAVLNNVPFTEIDEVVLIGGATRVPAVRTMLREAFPHIRELSTSVHPVSAVAQGAAIQAAWLSHSIPFHALEGALMLDTTPYPLGILQSAVRGVPQQIILSRDPHDVFFELIPRDSRLPAMGSMTFGVSDPRGVTVLAVEYVPEEDLFVVLNEFSFLLRRTAVKERSIEVGMRLTEQGEVLVSIFDANDPDHVRARGIVATVEDTSLSKEQWSLLVGCFVLFGMYVILKIQFATGAAVIEEEL